MSKLVDLAARNDGRVDLGEGSLGSRRSGSSKRLRIWPYHWLFSTGPVCGNVTTETRQLSAALLFRRNLGKPLLPVREMNIQAKLIVVALSCITASCGTISADIQESDGTSQMTESLLLGASKSSSGSTAAAPAGEVANYVNAQMQKFRRLKSYDSDAIVVDGNAKVPGGRFVGNLVLDQKRTSLIGSGVGQTVIDG